MSTINENLKAAMDYASQRSSVKQSHAPDGCCAKHISKALRKGDLDTAEIWNCPKCGTEWKPSMVSATSDMANPIRHWQPYVTFEVWRRR